jgi:hypothetical protein
MEVGTRSCGNNWLCSSPPVVLCAGDAANPSSRGWPGISGTTTTTAASGEASSAADAIDPVRQAEVTGCAANADAQPSRPMTGCVLWTHHATGDQLLGRRSPSVSRENRARPRSQELSVSQKGGRVVVMLPSSSVVQVGCCGRGRPRLPMSLGVPRRLGRIVRGTRSLCTTWPRCPDPVGARMSTTGGRWDRCISVGYRSGVAGSTAVLRSC